MTVIGRPPAKHCGELEDHGDHGWGEWPRQVCYGSHRGWILPHPEVIKADPATCPHGVLDEMAGTAWGFEDCVTCGKRFPMRSDDDYDEPSEP